MLSAEEMYRKYARNVYQYLLSMTQDAGLAEELTQDTFCEAVRCIGKYDGSCRVTTWLCAIAKNRLYSYRRHHPDTVPLEYETPEGGTVSPLDDSPAPSAEESVLEADGHLRLLRQLHTLKEPYREVLYLRIFGSLSFREIGSVFGKTENWARVTFYRGKEQLRKELEA